MRCNKCGNENNDNTKFCSFCGHKLFTEEEHKIKKDYSTKFLITMLIITAIIIFIIAATFVAFKIYNSITSPTIKKDDFSQNENASVEDGFVTDDNNIDTEVIPKETVGDTEESVKPDTVDYYRCYVYSKNNNYKFDESYYPALQLYDDGTFTFTENLGNGMCKYYGTYKEDDISITLSVSDSIYSRVGIDTITFTKSETQLKINNKLVYCSTGDVFVRDDNYSVSDAFEINEENSGNDTEDDYSYMFNDREKTGYMLDTSLTGYVSADGGLFIRKGPGTDRDTVILIPDTSLIIIYGANDDNSWFFVEYNGIYGWSCSDYINVNY